MSGINVALVVIVVALAVATLTWLYSIAQRLDRLHVRLDRSRDALQAALDRRCAVVAALYPQLAPLAAEVEQMRLTPTDLAERLVSEEAFMSAVAEAQRGDAPAPLQDANTRVELAMRFYNDAVDDTLALRLRPTVRALHLGGTAALPQFAGGHR